MNDYAKENFKKLVATNQIIAKESFSFPEKITPLRPSISIEKSLYQCEESMNNLEQKMILEIASYDNVLFWHRNLSKGKGFFINGYESNHYPDFIIKTKRGNIILIETKGDHLDNDDSKNKRELGRIWAEKAGHNFKYFMVFESKNVEGAFTFESIKDVIKMM